MPPCDGYTGYGGYTDPCPTVTPTPTATPTTQPTVVPTTVPTATPVPPPRDTRPCRVTARAPRQTLRTVRRSGLRLRLTTDERCRLAVTASVDRTTARRLGLGRRSVTVAQSTRTLPAGTRTVAVKLTRKAARAAQRARSLRLSISIATRDVAGNTGRLTVRTTLRR